MLSKNEIEPWRQNDKWFRFRIKNKPSNNDLESLKQIEQFSHWFIVKKKNATNNIFAARTNPPQQFPCVSMLAGEYMRQAFSHMTRYIITIIAALLYIYDDRRRFDCASFFNIRMSSAYSDRWMLHDIRNNQYINRGVVSFIVFSPHSCIRWICKVNTLSIYSYFFLDLFCRKLLEIFSYNRWATQNINRNICMQVVLYAQIYKKRLFVFKHMPCDEEAKKYNFVCSTFLWSEVIADGGSIIERKFLITRQAFSNLTCSRFGFFFLFSVCLDMRNSQFLCVHMASVIRTLYHTVLMSCGPLWCWWLHNSRRGKGVTWNGVWRIKCVCVNDYDFFCSSIYTSCKLTHKDKNYV